MLARPTVIASHPILVHRVAVSIHASFRPRLTTTPLRFTCPSPPSGWTGDLHPQANQHARHTCKKPSENMVSEGSRDPVMSGSVGDTGFEPEFENPLPVSTLENSLIAVSQSAARGAAIPADFVPDDADLTILISAWPGLSVEVRKQIVQIVQSVRNKTLRLPVDDLHELELT
jgi:hypothetical protein